MLCSMCVKSPCDGRCPYAEVGDAVYHCRLCDESVQAGEFFIEMGGDCYHRRCVELLDAGDWLSLVDTAAELAEVC
ncbi:MAG: hypothetical protein FWE06_07890 [Oscillospiraceae bacterium]|nr:hypothetical protein [Oscillospiraceae bacterium]